MKRGVLQEPEDDEKSNGCPVIGLPARGVPIPIGAEKQLANGRKGQYHFKTSQFHCSQTPDKWRGRVQN
jgi:hypothetical protein